MNLTELAKKLGARNMSLDEVSQGIEVLNQARRFGIPLKRTGVLLLALENINDSQFIQGAVKLKELEKETGMDFVEIVSRSEKLKVGNQILEKKNIELVREVESNQKKAEEARKKNEGIQRKKKEQEAEFVQASKEMRAELSQMKWEKQALSSSLESLKSELSKTEDELNREMAEQDLIRGNWSAFKEFQSYLDSTNMEASSVLSVARDLQNQPENRKEKLSQLLERYGSLEKAEAELEKQISRASHREAELNNEVEALERKEAELKESISNKQWELDATGKRWELFEAFLAMLRAAPSRTMKVTELQDLFGRFKEYWPEEAEFKLGFRVFETALSQLGAIPQLSNSMTFFLATTMGRYLHSFKCKNCGAQFITNSDPKPRGCNCPLCVSLSIQTDDTFLNKFLIPGSVPTLGEVKNMRARRAMETFMDIPCRICGEPLSNSWSREEIIRTFSAYGWAHKECLQREKQGR